MRKSITYLFVILFINLLSFGCKTDTSNNTNPANSNFITIAPNIYLYKDICNVYVLKSGSSALLIDAGSGAITDHLHEIGIDKIDWVLNTHYHRDQTLGNISIQKAGAKIAISEKEAGILDREELSAPFSVPKEFLLNGELAGWGRRMAPFVGLNVDKELNEGEKINWKEFTITAIETPGHTEGSLSYIVESNNKKFCFSGDLILEGGRVRNLYSMQWIYLGNPGINASIPSLHKVNDLNPDILLPSHGEIIKHVQENISLLNQRLLNFKKAFTKKRAGRWNWSQMVQVSEHVVQDGGSTTQIVISHSGKALLFDCGKEFSPERLKEAKTKFGVKKVDVIIPSHWHYDHVEGISEMVKAEGSKVWAWEGLAEYLKHPEHFPTTCWRGKSIKVDRILKEKEIFEWEGYSFKVYHNPVHTEQQMGLYIKVDGLDFYFVADGTGLSREGIRSSIHCYNGLSLSSGLLKSAQSFNEATPYIVLPAHSNVFAINKGDKEEYLDWALQTTDVIKELLPPTNTDLAYDPYWATFYPTRTHINAGDSTKISLRIKNYSEKNISGICRLKSYGDIIFENNTIEYEIKPRETKDFPVRIKTKQIASKGVHVVTADIEYGNEVFAEFPQAYIQIDD